MTSRLLFSSIAGLLALLAATATARAESPTDPVEQKHARDPVLVADGLVGVLNSDYAQTTLGGRVQLAIPFHAIHLVPSAGYQDQYRVAVLGEKTGNAVSGGIAVGYGAPFDLTKTWGLALEGGMIGGTRKAGVVDTTFRPDNAPLDYFTPYVQASVVAQLRLDPTIRPYAAAIGRHVVDQYGESVQVAMLAVGVAWNLF